MITRKFTNLQLEEILEKKSSNLRFVSSFTTELLEGFVDWVIIFQVVDEGKFYKFSGQTRVSKKLTKTHGFPRTCGCVEVIPVEQISEEYLELVEICDRESMVP